MLCVADGYLTCWTPTRWVFLSYYSCGPCACKVGKPVLVFSQVFKRLIYKAHDCKLCTIQLFSCSKKKCTLNEQPGHRSIFWIYARCSWKLPGIGSVATVKFPGKWKGQVTSFVPRNIILSLTLQEMLHQIILLMFEQQFSIKWW